MERQRIRLTGLRGRLHQRASRVARIGLYLAQ
jgi:hypothetical protein